MELRTWRPGGVAWRVKSHSNSGGPRWGLGCGCPRTRGPAWRGQALACLLPKHWPCGPDGSTWVVGGWVRRLPGEAGLPEPQPSAEKGLTLRDTEGPRGCKRMGDTACPVSNSLCLDPQVVHGPWRVWTSAGYVYSFSGPDRTWSWGWAQQGSPPLLGSSASREGSRESWRLVEVLPLPCPGVLALERGWAWATMSPQQAQGPDCPPTGSGTAAVPG